MLADVDARLRSAGGTLRAAVEEAIELPPSLPKAPHRRPPRRVWLAAAVVVLVAGSAAVVLSRVPADDTDDTVRASVRASHTCFRAGFPMASSRRSPSGSTANARPSVSRTGAPLRPMGRSRSSRPPGTSTTSGPSRWSSRARAPTDRGARSSRRPGRGRREHHPPMGGAAPALVTVIGTGVSDRELDRFVDALPAQADEIEDALRQYGQSSRPVTCPRARSSWLRASTQAADGARRQRRRGQARDHPAGRVGRHHGRRVQGELEDDGFVSAVPGDTGARPRSSGSSGPAWPRSWRRYPTRRPLDSSSSRSRDGSLVPSSCGRRAIRRTWSSCSATGRVRRSAALTDTRLDGWTLDTT